MKLWLNIIIEIFYLLNNLSAENVFVNDTSKKTNDSIAVYTYQLNDFRNPYLNPFKYIDTSLTSFQFNNPSYKISPFITSLGNIGLPERNLYFKAPEISFFSTGNYYINSYMYNPNNDFYILSKNAFTELYYTNGSIREQIFRVIQALPIKKNFYLGANYLIVNSNGREFFRQKSANEHLSINSKFITKKNNYAIFASYIHNKIKFQENGGIKNDSLFENRSDKKENTTYWLNSAETRYKESYVSVNQYYNYDKKLPFNKTDSNYYEIKKNKLLITHNFQFKRSFRIYEDNEPLSGFYPNVYLNNEKTYDSTFCSAINNKINFASTFFKKDSINDYIKINLFAEHEYTQWKMYNVDTSYNGIMPGMAIQFNPLKKLILECEYKYILSGYCKNDYQIDFSTIKLFNKDKGLKFVFRNSNNEPEYIYNYYVSNHFIWQNNFVKQKFNSISLSYFSENVNSGFSMTKADDLLYFDVLARPKQLNIPAYILSLWVKTVFNFYNFTLCNNFMYNNVFNVDVLRYPAFQDAFEFSWGKKLFKSALLMQIGFDIAWNSSYKALSYMPATGIFYIQNDKKIGNYPYCDIFLNFKIKQARIFIKYQHFNNGWFSTPYYDSPHYPSPESAFKLGISWYFYN